MKNENLSTIADLRRELATRDAFLARVSAGLDARIAALGSCTCEGVAALRGFARELAIISGREDARMPRRERLNVGDCIEGCIQQWTAQMPMPREEFPPLHVQRMGELGGSFDAAHIETMLMELLSNAFKYGAGKPVSLRIEGRGDFVRIVVEDEGAGIAPRARIGQRFVRGRETKEKPGFGVGVWLVRTLAQASGGTFRLSRRPGGGTRATVTLPRDC